MRSLSNLGMAAGMQVATARAAASTVAPRLLQGFRSVLRDGSPVRLRPVRPEDRTRLVAGMAALSPDARYFRFFTPQPVLTEEQLHYFTEVDQRRHVAWLAVNPSTPDEAGMGIGRFVRREDDPASAEFALTVVDACQRKGLGTLILALLAGLAASRGVRYLEGIVLPENRVVTGWLEKLGARLTCGEGLWHVRLRVSGSPKILSATAERFWLTVAAVRRVLRLNNARWGVETTQPQEPSLATSGTPP